LGVVWGDFDGDGWPDLFEANDSGPNFLYHNKHNGTFEDLALLYGVAVSSDGHQLGNMAADFGDFDRDGNLDLIVTDFGNQPISLYRNLGARGFTDVSWSAKVGQPSYPFVKWGVGFVDFDNDGWPDIFVVNGNVIRQMDSLPSEAKYREPIQLFRNKGSRTFEDMASRSGLNDGPLQSRRGAAFGDVNNDGNVDVVVYNVGGPPSLFLNETRNSNHRVLFRLIGTKSNRAAIGARLTVHAGELAQTDEIRGGGSYLSSNDQRLHFGLGSNSVMDKVEIRWPSGSNEEFENLPADAIYTIVEREGIKGKIKLPPPESALK
jgi:hypothetical protein